MLIHLLVFPRRTVARLSVHACTLLVLQQAGMIDRWLDERREAVLDETSDATALLQQARNARHGQCPRPAPLQQAAIARPSISIRLSLCPSISLSPSSLLPVMITTRTVVYTRVIGWSHVRSMRIYPRSTRNAWAPIRDQTHCAKKTAEELLPVGTNGTCIDDEQE